MNLISVRGKRPRCKSVLWVLLGQSLSPRTPGTEKQGPDFNLVVAEFFWGERMGLTPLPQACFEREGYQGRSLFGFVLEHPTNLRNVNRIASDEQPHPLGLKRLFYYKRIPANFSNDPLLIVIRNHKLRVLHIYR